MTTQQSKQRFNRPNATFSGEENFSPIEQNEQDDQNVTRGEIEEEMQVLETELATTGKQLDVKG